MESVKMNHKQAYRFAVSIFADIELYVENHLKEFEAYKQQELLKDQEEE